jgi:hypothetical protein
MIPLQPRHRDETISKGWEKWMGDGKDSEGLGALLVVWGLRSTKSTKSAKSRRSTSIGVLEWFGEETQANHGYNEVMRETAVFRWWGGIAKVA